MDTPGLTIHLPELQEGRRRLYLCSIDDVPTGEPPWNDLADCLSHIPLDVVASSHQEDAEETADVIHRAAVTTSQTTALPMRIVSPRLSTSERYVAGIQQILRDFGSANHICLVQHSEMLAQTTLWQELVVFQDAAAFAGGDSGSGGESCNLQHSTCRIHVLDHHMCDTLGCDRWTLQMFNFCCDNANEWQ